MYARMYARMHARTHTHTQRHTHIHTHARARGYAWTMKPNIWTLNYIHYINCAISLSFDAPFFKQERGGYCRDIEGLRSPYFKGSACSRCGDMVRQAYTCRRGLCGKVVFSSVSRTVSSVVLQHGLPADVNLPIYPFGASAILIQTVPAVRNYI